MTVLSDRVDALEATNSNLITALNGLRTTMQQTIDTGQGPQGWSPQLVIVNDGARRVLQILDWTNGAPTHAKPASGGYIGSTGIVTTAAEAIDIRGEAGLAGNSAYDEWLTQGNVGTELDFLNDLSAQAVALTDANVTAAQTAETNASASATAAGISETNAGASETAAGTSATNAAASETAAGTSATNAAASQTAASTSETNAAAFQTAASTSETNAAASETAAAGFATAAGTSETNAASSASAAQSAQTATENIFDQFGDQYLGSKASDPTLDNDGDRLTTGDIYFNTTNEVLKFYSGTAWIAPETVASTAANNAEASATAAATSETNAGSSATAASTSETNAAASETAAATSETNATGSATAAGTSETNAANSATAASTSETNAGNSETAALGYKNTTQTLRDDVLARFIGNYIDDAGANTSGFTIAEGVFYWNTTSKVLRIYSGTAWSAAVMDANGAMIASNNLSDLTSVPTARDNLGLGSAAPLNVPATGDAAVGQVVKGSDTRLSDARAPTTHTHTKSQISDFVEADYATGTEGELAGTAVQPADIGSAAYNESGDFTSQTSLTGSAAIPSGTKLQRDGAPAAGYLRFNSDTGSFEGHDGTEWGNIGGSGGGDTLGSLTKSFASGETSTIALSAPITAGAPVVSVTKEVPQIGVTSNTWDVITDGMNYERHDSAYSTTLTPSNDTGDGVFSMWNVSFASADVGKTIEGNGGEAILTATDGSYKLVTAFNDATQINSGDWSMFATVFDPLNGIELSGINQGYDLINASYDAVFFDVGTVSTGPRSVEFKPDGTKMYFADRSNTSIYQYSLSTPWDPSTASYDAISFNTGNEDTAPVNMKFKPDGTKMYVLGILSGHIYQYSLSTPWDLRTVSYDTMSLDLTNQDSDPYGLVLKPDGTKIYISGNPTNSIYQYSLATAWDLSTAFYDAVSFNTGNEDTTPVDLAFKPDGTKMYMLGYDTPSIYQYSLATAWDLDTVSYDAVSLGVGAEEPSAFGIKFKPDGTKMYIVGGANASIYQYSTAFVSQPLAQYIPLITNIGGQIDSTEWTDINSMVAGQVAGDGQIYYAVSTDGHATWKVIDNTSGERSIVRDNAGTWEVNDASTYTGTTWVAAAINTELDAIQEALTTAGQDSQFLSGSVYDNMSFSTSYEEITSRTIFFKPDGTKMYTLGNSNDTVFQYTLSTAWEVSTASYDTVSFNISSESINPFGMVFKPDGTKMYLVDPIAGTIHQYTLATAWDLSTASYDTVSFSTGSQDSTCVSVDFKNDGTKMYILGNSTGAVHQYSLSTPWDLSTVSYDAVSFNVTSEDSFSVEMVFNSNGTKMYLLGNNTTSVYQYNLASPWDLNTASYDNTAFNVANEEDTPYSMAFKPDGSKMYILGDTNDSVYQYTTGSISYLNQMDKTQLEAVTDANHYMLGDSLDLMVALYLGYGSVNIPSSDGVSINYDANVRNEGAVLGTDYDFDFPATDVVRLTSNATQNLKVRVV